MRKRKKGIYNFKFDWENVQYSLTPKQKKFCELYFKLNNATKAAIAAGYGEKSAAAESSHSLRKDKIRAYNAFLLDQSGFNVESVCKEHLKLLVQNKDLTNKRGAIDMFYKLRGEYAAEKHETKTTVKFEDLTDEQLNSEIKALNGKSQ